MSHTHTCLSKSFVASILRCFGALSLAKSLSSKNSNKAMDRSPGEIKPEMNDEIVTSEINHLKKAQDRVVSQI